MQSFKSIPILVLEIWGKKGSKMGVFAIILKTRRVFWFILLGIQDIIVLHMLAKFQVHINSGSWDMGQKGVKNDVFPHFLGNAVKDLVRFPREGRSYSDTYVYQISCSANIWFSRYGQTRDLLKKIKIYDYLLKWSNSKKHWKFLYIDAVFIMNEGLSIKCM